MRRAARFRPFVRPGLVAALGAAVLLAAVAAPPAAAQKSTAADAELSPAEKLRFESLIREYLMNNPEVILQAVQKLKEREAAQAKTRSREAIAENAAALFDDPDSPQIGPADAPVTLVEFLDYQCGYCKKMFPILHELAERRDDLRIVFKDLPFLGPKSRVAARAALAAQRQDAYYAFHEAVMTMRGQLSKARLLDVAASLGLDVDRLERDMADPAIDARIDGNVALARALGIGGTPALVVGETLIPGAVGYDQLARLVDRAKAEADKGTDTGTAEPGSAANGNPGR